MYRLCIREQKHRSFAKKDPQWVHKTNSHASPTPIIEGGKMYFQNGSYGTACLDMKSGKVLWRIGLVGHA